MSEPHVVESLEFAVGFVDEDDAFEAQSRLGDFLRRSAQGVIGSVFDEFDRADQLTSFESLEIDLGCVAGTDLEDQWARRLRERLRELLWHEIAAAPGAAGGNRQTIRKQEVRLDRLMQFLSDGHASWRSTDTDMRELARTVLAADAPQLLDRLRAGASPQRALTRLLSHLNDRDVGAVLALLSPIQARDIGALLDRYFARGRLRGLPTAKRAALRRRLLIAISEPLLLDAASASSLTKAMDALVDTFDHALGETDPRGIHPKPFGPGKRNGESGRRRAVADKATRSPAYEQWLWARLRARFQRALESGEQFAVAAVWREFLQVPPSVLRAHLLQKGALPEVRRSMVRCFADTMLLELVGLFVPTDRGFIETAVRHVDETAQSAPVQPAPPAGLKAGLWEFTLAHLLVDRGSAFNRRSYLGAMLQMVALRESIDFAALLRAMTAALHATGVATGLPRELLQVLMELETEQQQSRELIASLADSRPAAAAGRTRRASRPTDGSVITAFRARFSAALEARELARFGPAWRQVRRHDAEWTEQELRRQGQAESLRRHLALALPEPVLVEVAELLAPGEGVFLASAIQVVAPLVPAMFSAPREALAVRRELWEFTLTYLMVERGSAYNKRSYMDSLLRQMAAREAVDYRDILDAVRLALDQVTQPGPLQRQMRALVAELLAAAGRGEADSPDAGRDAAGSDAQGDALRAAFQSALADASGKSWLSLLQGSARHRDADLLANFLRIGQAPAARERLIATLPEAVRPTLLALLVPQESRFIAAAIADTAAACAYRNGTAVERPAIASHLWEFTLTFVLTEQGGGFNRRSYAAYLLQKLASRHGLQYRALLRDITVVLQATAMPAASPAQGSLLQILLELARIELPAATIEPVRAPEPAAAAADVYQAAATMRSLLSAAGEWSPDAVARLREVAEVILAAGSVPLTTLTETMLCDRGCAQRFIDALPDHLLSAWLYRLRPADHYAMQRSVWHIAQACLLSAAAPGKERLRRLQWQFLFRYLFEPGGQFSVADFARRFAAFLAEQLRVLEPVQWQHALLAAVDAPADGRDRELVRAIREAAVAPQAAAHPPAVRASETPAEASRKGDIDLREPIYVGNAGLVMLAPYLPRLFEMRGLIADDKIADAAAHQRAILLTHYAVFASAAPDEAELVLNKILSGATPSFPFDFATRLDEADRNCVEGLLQSVIGHWSALGSTSVAGLREAFLQREGRLLRADDGWELHVAERGIDALLDRLPWGFSTIKYSWMEGMLHVTWR